MYYKDSFSFKNNVFYKTLQKVNHEDRTTVSDFFESSQQRIKTQQFLNSKSQFLLKSIVNKQSPKGDAPQYNRRTHVSQAEKLFLLKICDGNRKELLQKMEEFISEQLLEEFKELAHLFKTFMKELRAELTDQSLQLTINEKKLEIQNIDDFQRMRRTLDRESQSLVDRIQKQDSEICNMKTEQQRVESMLKDFIEKNRALKIRLDLKEKEIILKDQKIKNLIHEVGSLENKILYFENKLQQAQKKNMLNSELRRSFAVADENGKRKSNVYLLGGSFANQPHQQIMVSVPNSKKVLSDSESEEGVANELYQLNEIEVNYERIVQIRDKETQIEGDLIILPVGQTQTELRFIGPEYDVLTQNIIETAVKYNEFLSTLSSRLEQEESDYEMLVQEAFDFMDEPTLINEKKDHLPPQIFKKRESKIKSVLKFIHFQKGRIIQLDSKLEENTQKLSSMFTKCDTLVNENCRLEDENDRLLAQLKHLHQELERWKTNQQVTQDQVVEVSRGEAQSSHHQSNPNTKLQSQQVIPKPFKKTRKQFQLGQKITISYDFQKNQSKQLIDKVKAKKIGKFQNYMPQKIVLKYITTMYQDKINAHKENKFIRDQDMSAFIYNYYLQQFGYTKVTEQRFLILVMSVQKQIKIIRVNMFARFMNLLDDHSNFNLEEQQKYLEALEFVQAQHNLGVTIKDNESEQKFYVPYVRAMAYLGQLQNFCLSQEESARLKLDVEHLKENDPKNINKLGIVDFDLMMMRVLQYFRNNFEKTKTYVINAFAACDLDGNGMCNIDEWLLLNKYIEPEKYDEDKLLDLFDEQADIFKDEEKNLSFDRFSLLCMEWELFSDKQQNRFLQIRNNEDLDLKYKDLQRNWGEIYIQQLEEMQNHESREGLAKWREILDVLNEKITKNQGQQKPLLIAYKIFLQEWKQS